MTKRQYKRWFKKVEKFCEQFDKVKSVERDDTNAFASFVEDGAVLLPYDFNNIHPTTAVGTFHFMRHLATVHHKLDAYKYSSNFWSVLHEVGHIYTTRFDVLSEGLRQYREMQKGNGFIREARRLGLVETDYEYQAMYFNTIFEHDATAWAVRWVEEHPKEAKYWSKRLK